MNLNKKIHNSRNFWVISAVYFLLLLKAGFFFVEEMNIVTAPLYLLYLLLIAAFYGKNSMDENACLAAMILFALRVVNWCFNGAPALNAAVMWVVNLCTAVVIVLLFSEQEFKKAFASVIYVMCIAGIVGAILNRVNPRIIQLLPRFSNSKGLAGYFGVFSFFSYHSGAFRLEGLFWEPGAFQAFIIFAMLIENYRLGGRIKRLIVYSIAIVLTYSSTGIVCLAFFWLLKVSSSGKKNFRFLILIFLIAVVALVYALLSSKLTGFLKYTLVDKFQGIFDYSVGGEHSSGSVRIDSVVLPLMNYYKNIPFGLGEGGYEELRRIVGHAMFTCTPVNYFVYDGLISGCISFYGFYHQFSEKLTFLQRIAVVLLIMLSVSTESLSGNPILTVFILYGFRNIRFTAGQKGALRQEYEYIGS